jgi:hypothetical protein
VHTRSKRSQLRADAVKETRSEPSLFSRPEGSGWKDSLYRKNFSTCSSFSFCQ